MIPSLYRNACEYLYEPLADSTLPVIEFPESETPEDLLVINEGNGLVEARMGK
jgi:hypothetical protein